MRRRSVPSKGVSAQWRDMTGFWPEKAGAGHIHPSYGLAPLTATFEGGELRALFRRREDARGHPHFRRALAARSFHRRKLEGAGGTSPFVRTGVVMP